MIKNLQDYQKLARRTCPSLGSDKLDLAHMCLGMCSELSELSDAFSKNDDINASEELADIMWYLGNYATTRGILLNLPEDTDKNAVLYDEMLDWYIHELSDISKKYIAYNKNINSENELFLINGILYKISILFSDILLNAPSLLKALENNINKLKVRYPEKFTEEAALNRNLVAERIELEKI